jgi:hypothetical protein
MFLPLSLVVAVAVAQIPATEEVVWHWDKESPGCSLLQKTDDGPTVTLTRVPGQDETTIALKVRSPNFWKGLYDGGSVTLSTGASFPATIQVFSVENRQYQLDASITDPAFTNALASSRTLTIAHRDFGKFSVSPRKLASALAALRSCEDARMRDWGIDVGKYWALASRPHPIGHLVDLFNSDNYPAGAAISSIERNVIATTKVGTDGRVIECSAPGNFAYPQFVDSVCGVLKKGARFEPARDSSGETVPAPYVVLVGFRLRY